MSAAATGAGFSATSDGAKLQKRREEAIAKGSAVE
jgi:hypothetical protein